MRSPTILDIVQAVIELAPSHPEVAVWWYAGGSGAGAPPILLVLEAGDGAIPDTVSIGSALEKRFGPGTVAARPHRGSGESQALHRLLTTGARGVPASHAEGS